jgi:hypothetical protein
MKWLRWLFRQPESPDPDLLPGATPVETGDPESGALARLDAWLDGELTADEAAELERLVEADPAARESFHWVRRRNTLVSKTSAYWDIRGEEAHGEDSSPADVVAAEVEESVLRPGVETNAFLMPPGAPLSSYGARRPLGRLLERRAAANRHFERAREAEAGGRPAEALAAVAEIFDLSDPRTLLGPARLADLMDLAARCHAAQAAEREAAEWRRRAAALRQEGQVGQERQAGQEGQAG